MTYEEAFKIGSVAEGTILATCAEFWDMNGRKLFSFQRENSTVTIDENADIPKITLDNGKSAFLFRTDTNTYAYKFGAFADAVKTAKEAMAVQGDENALVLDFPIIRAYQSTPKNGKVPVTLLPDAIDEIKRRILKKEKVYYVYAEYTEYTNGNWLYPEQKKELLYRGKTPKNLSGIQYEERYKDLKEYELSNIIDYVHVYGRGKRKIGNNNKFIKELQSVYEVDQVKCLDLILNNQVTSEKLGKTNENGEYIIPRVIVNLRLVEEKKEEFSDKYKILDEKLKRGEQFMVKTAAFDWFAININNATIATTNSKGETIAVPLNEYIAEAKAKLDKAKTLIAAAGAATIL